MVGVPEALTAAREYASRVFPPEELRGLRVEEIKMSDDGRHWLITLGWLEAATRTITPTFGSISSSVVQAPRVYKTFKVDAESGSVIAMLMRD